MNCPRCNSSKLQKKGKRDGKQRYRCMECSSSFTEGIPYKEAPKYSEPLNLTCAHCGSTHIVREGKLIDGAQRFKCRQCGLNFSENSKDSLTTQWDSQKRKKEAIDLILKGTNMKKVSQKSGFSDRYIREFMKPYWAKEVLSKAQKELIIKYGHFLKVPVDYLAEYVPCSEYTCRKILKEYRAKSTNSYAT